MEKLDPQDVVRLTAHWTRAQPVVAGFVSSVVSNYHDAEDIIQNVSMVVAVRFQDYDPQRNFTKWALGIAKNKVLVYYRDQKKEKQILDKALIERIENGYGDMAPQLGPVHEALRRCMNKIKTRDRQLLVKWYVEQRGPDDITHSMGIAKSTVYVILHRMRMALKHCIQRQLIIMKEI